MTNDTDIGYQSILAFGARKTLTAAVFAVSLGLAGCGSDDDNNGGNSSNNAPELTVTTQVVTEDSVSTATVVATLAATDADGDDLTYRLVNNTDGYFAISGTDVVLTSNGVIAVNDDSLNLTSLPLTVRVSDGTDTDEETATVSITRIDDTVAGNTAPVLTATAATGITEDSVSTSTIVATLSATDADGDTLNYSLVDNTDGYFTISGETVVLTDAGVAAVNDDALGLTSLAVNVRVSDGTDADEETVTVSITRIDDSEQPREIKLFEDDFEAGSVDKWDVVSVSSGNDWSTESYSGNQFAVANCYQADAACDDWMITPELAVSTFTSAQITFTNAWNYGTGVDQIALKVSTDYAGDTAAATWTDISDRVTWSSGDFTFVDSGVVDLSDFVGNNIRVAFHYETPVADATKWEIDDVVIKGMGTGDFPLDAEIAVAGEHFYTDRAITFNGSAVNGAGEPFTYAWDFGDGGASADENATHAFAEAGRYQVDLTVTDKDSNAITKTRYVDVQPETAFALPAKAGDFRIATFNAGFDKQAAEGEQATAFAAGDYRQAQKVAEIIQRSAPDILLLNEIDGNDSGATVTAFKTNYLEVAQADDVQAAAYDYVYYSACNTGLLVTEIDADFNNDDVVGGPDDRYGFGNYNGQYCMAIFSKYAIDTTNARTFQEFLWKDMPGALEPSLEGVNWYSTEEWNIFRLSSKTHIDLPVDVNGTMIHVLASHPTPPVYDGAEDRNGKRNFDEIRLWADYIDPTSNYLYDDNGNADVTLAENTRFVIMGDENASAVEGDAHTNDSGVMAINQLLDSPLVNPNMAEDSETFQVPTSAAGAANNTSSVYASTHTAGWAIRADYVLPSAYGLKVAQGGVFWPQESDDLYYLVSAMGEGDVESSDHRMVWMDLEIFDGTTAIQNATTEVTLAEVDITATTFDTEFELVVGDGNSWAASSRDGVEYAEANCFSSSVDCDSWLIYTADLSDTTQPLLQFNAVNNYAAGGLTVVVSTDFVPGTDPSTANWTTLDANLPAPQSWDWVTVEGVDMSTVAGESAVYVAFHYADNSGNGAALWRISDFTITEERVPEPTTVASVDITAATFETEFALSTGDGNSWGASARDGVEYAEANCYSSSVDCDSWLIYSADLSGATSPALSFNAINNYAAGGLTIEVSTDFVPGNDPSTATWMTLEAELPASQSWDWVAIDNISLSTVAGEAPVYIAFHYVDNSGSGAALWRIKDFTIMDGVIVDGGDNGSVGVGETVVADTAPGYATLNDVNQRAMGTLEFAEVTVPANATEETSVIGSSALTIDGTEIPGSGYKTLMKSGDLIDGNVYGQIKDKNGADLFVSNYNEFASILPVGDRVFAVSQFESIPGGIHLVELSQDSTTGELSTLSTELLDMSHVHGGYNHCAAMVTPWNTHLASEEYEPDYRLRSESTGEIDAYYNEIEMYHAGDSLLDVNPYWYGYAVEVAISIDGSDNVSTSINKHYAMGRMAIEIAYVMPDRKTVYLTDDGTNGGLYMFVADAEEDLSAGSLYAMKWNQTDAGSDANAAMGEADIEWVALGHATNDDIATLINGDSAVSFTDIFDAVDPVDDQCPLGYDSINHKGSQECLRLKSDMALAASRLETRRYAALMGATVEMRKEEGFTYSPHNHKAYMAISDIARGMLNNDSRDTGGENHIQLSTENQCGGLFELSLGSNDEIGSDFVVGNMKGLIAGVEDGSACAVDRIAGPDNVAYVGYNTLVITEDTGDHANNFVWAYDLEAEQLTRIFSAPTGAENTGPYMFHNINGFSYITNVVQHPAGEKADPSAGNEAEVGYFGPIPYVAPASGALSVTEALAVAEDQKVIEVVGVITSTVVNGNFALEMADVDDAGQVIVVKLNGDDRTLWGPEANPSAAGTTITVIGERDLDGYSGRQSIEGSTQITAN